MCGVYVDVDANNRRLFGRFPPLGAVHSGPRPTPTHYIAMLFVALSSSALIVGLRPAVQPVTVRAMAEIHPGGGLAPPGAETLADQYRNRWAGDDGVVRTRPPTVGEASSGAFSGGALSDVVTGDSGPAPVSKRQTVGEGSANAFSSAPLTDVVAGESGPAPVSKTRTVGEASANAFSGAPLTDVVCIIADDGAEVCGPASFDSVEGGVVCVETEAGEQVCAADA